MNKASRVAAATLLVTTLGAGAAGTSAQTPAPVQPPQIVEQVLVRVNGDIITKSDLEERQISALRQRNIDPEKLASDEQLKKALAEVTPQILVSAIEELLLTQLGREKGLKLSDEMFNRWLANMRKEQNLEDEKRFQDALKTEGMTLTDVRRNVERQFLISEVQRDEFGGKLQITEDDARQYYKANQNEFTEPASVMLREILIEVPAAAQQSPVAATPGQDAAAEKAKAIRARLAAGEDFAKVAGEVSSGPTAANGGLAGPLAEQELSTSLQQLLEKMKPGDISEPLKTPRGYQIVKLESRKPPTVKPFESVRDLVADRVYQHRARSEMRRFLDRVRRQAIIVWKNDELRKAYEQQLAAMGSADPG